MAEVLVLSLVVTMVAQLNMSAAAAFAGNLQSYRDAFAWQRCLVHCLHQDADQPAVLSKQANILGDMLSSGRTGAKCAHYLHRNSRLVLAVGAYLFGMRHTQDGEPVVVWLQDCMEVMTAAVTVISLCNDCFDQGNCLCIRLSLLRATTAARMQWLVPNYIVLMTKVSFL